MVSNRSITLIGGHVLQTHAVIWPFLIHMKQINSAMKYYGNGPFKSSHLHSVSQQFIVSCVCDRWQ